MNDVGSIYRRFADTQKAQGSASLRVDVPAADFTSLFSHVFHSCLTVLGKGVSSPGEASMDITDHRYTLDITGRKDVQVQTVPFRVFKSRSWDPQHQSLQTVRLFLCLWTHWPVPENRKTFESKITPSFVSLPERFERPQSYPRTVASRIPVQGSGATASLLES